jgi:putative ABC transport system permease protein
MVQTAWRMMWKEKARLLITVSGVGFSVMLILFLIGIYEGVKNGATSYVLHSPAEIWVCEKNSTNLLRSSSFLQSSVEGKLGMVRGVEKIAGILRVLVTAEIHGKPVTLFLFGFDPQLSLVAPSSIVQGTSFLGPGEIILDKAFAAKHKIPLGSSLLIKDKKFKVAGICEGTNAIVAQFGFTTLGEAQELLGFPGVVSFYLITLNHSAVHQDVISFLKQQFPYLSVFSKQEFIQNNLEEMKTGVLPILWTIAFFGAIIGIAVITLMLYGSVLEKREDYALLKAIGASQKYLIFLVIKQSLLGSLSGFFCGAGLNLILRPLLLDLVPEISLAFTWNAAIIIFGASLVIGGLGSYAPIRKLAHIFPMEVFR